MEAYYFLGKLDYTILRGEESIDLGVVWSHFCFGQVVERRKIKLRQSFPKRRGIGALQCFLHANGSLNSIGGSMRKPYFALNAHLF